MLEQFVADPYRWFFLKVMLKAGKYDLVHGIFEKMKRSGDALKALTYKGSIIAPSLEIWHPSCNY